MSSIIFMYILCQNIFMFYYGYYEIRIYCVKIYLCSLMTSMILVYYTLKYIYFLLFTVCVSTLMHN